MSKRTIILNRVLIISSLFIVCILFIWGWNKLKVEIEKYRLVSALREKNSDTIAKPIFQMIPEGLAIYVDGNNVFDFSPLAHLNCDALIITNMKSQNNLDFLGTDMSFTELSITDQGDLKDISTLKHSNLKILSLVAPELTDISPIKDLPLEMLVLKCGSLSELEPIRNLSNLKKLYLSGNFSEIGFLENLSQLESLIIISENVSDFSALKKLKNLKKLILYCKQLSDLSFLENMENLTWIEIDTKKDIDYNSVKLPKKVKDFFYYGENGQQLRVRQ